jgi:hypothetical protein
LGIVEIASEDLDQTEEDLVQQSGAKKKGSTLMPMFLLGLLVYGGEGGDAGDGDMDLQVTSLSRAF